MTAWPVQCPLRGMTDLESYVGHKVINGHCDCMFLYNIFRWEWTTIAELIAPRPMLFANSDQDPIYPMDGNLRVIDRLRKFYAMQGHPELIAEHVSPGGHDYRPDLRMAIFHWMNVHLKNDNGPVTDAEDRPIDGKRLRVFPEDKDLPRDAINARIDESFVPRGAPAPPAPGRLGAVEGRPRRRAARPAVSHVSRSHSRRGAQAHERAGQEPALAGHGAGDRGDDRRSSPARRQTPRAAR